MVSAAKPSLRTPDVATTDSDIKLPEFFPSKLTDEQIISFHKSHEKGNGNDKKNSAQKRQEQRDARRQTNNPDRGQDEEDKERARKSQQSKSRGNNNADPYYNGGNSDRDYGRQREANRVERCEMHGESCNFSGPNQDCYNDCVDFGRGNSNEDCAYDCKYIDTICYEDCRRFDNVIDCINECEENVDVRDCERECDDRYPDDDGFYDDCMDDCPSNNGDRSGRNNRCEDDCDDRWNRNSNKWDTCMDICDCEEDCDDRWNRNSNKWDNCMDFCD